MPVNVIALVRESGERFVFLYDGESYDTLLETIERFRADPELGLADCEVEIIQEKAWELWWKEMAGGRTRSAKQS